MDFTPIMWTRARRINLLVLGAVVLLTACTGPRSTTRDGANDTVDEDAARRAALRAVETFDPSPYPVRPPQRESDAVDHRVPERLMTGRADENVTRTVNGYRIQVYSATDKAQAEEFRERVRIWWTNAEDRFPRDLFGGEQPPLVVEYSQPYYRVRIGAFARRDRAQEALALISREFPDAFIARSPVTVTR